MTTSTPIRKMIGTVIHLAPRGAYRTLCGKSVELAKDRVSGWVSQECAACHSAAESGGLAGVS